ncbi:transcription initiation factor TFIID subunit 5-like [Daphnia pulex]|uniref:transcription initiation factor TFIID subunit 5-like n=1 Tax=Daphnia pulex TaxID=6669 RepID=UPI001EDF8020|nr:transcription initiation factor TFIID subunit 5-like [Daphnia pulex]
MEFDMNQISQTSNSNAKIEASESQNSEVPSENSAVQPVEPENVDSNTLAAVLQFLQKHNLKGTADILKKEARLKEDQLRDAQALQVDSEATNLLSSYKSEGDPNAYEKAYLSYRRFVESSLDVYKHELSLVLYPLFVHMYLEMIYNQHESEAAKFMERFSTDQEDYYQDDLKKVSFITKKEHMKGSDLMENFKSSQFTVRMSRDTYSVLKRFLQDKNQSIVMNVIQEHLYVDMYEGVPRNKAQVESTAGAMEGEANRQVNKTKIYYGLLKEPDIQLPVVEEEEDGEPGEGGEKPKKKKPKKDPLLNKKAKSDPNAPPASRLPLPDLRDIDKLEKVRALREASKRVALGPDNLPSICFYTMLNCAETVTCVEFCEDSSLLAVGFSDSILKVWSLVPQKLRAMKPAEQLADIDKEAEDVLVRMMDDKTGETMKVLHGHCGPVYAASFSHDRTLLLSSSEDATIRLWSLQTWTCLVVYKGHIYPVWDVRFSPHGYYFSSVGHDRTARLWATDHHQPLRIFAGHYSDVDVVQFHPNSNYVATGSSDRSVRLWDCVTGNCVRLMTGHKGTVSALCFSTDGRFLASGGADQKVLLWDLAHGHLLADLPGHTMTISSLAFSRDGTVFATSSLDGSIQLWDFFRMTDESSLEDVNISGHNPDLLKRSNAIESLRLARYPTKATPVMSLHFTRRNLLLAAGMFEG